VDDEWYRSSAWEEADQEHFEEKLRRARPRSRAQYIRLKACALWGSKRDDERKFAPALFQRVIREHPDDELEAAMAWADLGRFHVEEGEHELAADALRSCLDVEAALGGGLHTGSDLVLAEVIVSAEWADRYSEALDLLEAAERAGLTFKIDRWRWSITQARIAGRSGRDADAKSFAAEALALMDDPSPDFPRHPDVGLIDADHITIQELKRLAAP
jgi:hypothetical protein